MNARRHSSRLKGKGKGQAPAPLTGRVSKPAPTYYIGHAAIGHPPTVQTSQFVMRRNTAEPWDAAALERAVRAGWPWEMPTDTRLACLFLQRISEHRYRDLLRHEPGEARILNADGTVVVYDD